MKEAAIVAYACLGLQESNVRLISTNVVIILVSIMVFALTSSILFVVFARLDLVVLVVNLMRMIVILLLVTMVVLVLTLSPTLLVTVDQAILVKPAKLISMNVNLYHAIMENVLMESHLLLVLAIQDLQVSYIFKF